MRTGRMRVDAVVIGTIGLDFTRGGVGVTARAALVSSRSGQTHGWTESASWSTETFRAVEALKAAMERDLFAHHFTEEGDELTQPPTPAGNIHSPGRPAGIGEGLTDSGSPKLDPTDL